MKEPAFRAQFNDIWIELHRSMLKTFIHRLLSSNYRLTWRHDQEGIELVIHSGEAQLLLPMKLESECKTIVDIKEVEVSEEDLANCLEDLITESKGSAIVRTISDGTNYVSYFDGGKVVSVLKTNGGGEHMSDYPIGVKKKQSLISNASVRHYVICAEIDYHLMELKEAIDNNDYIAKIQIKDKLRKLSKEKELNMKKLKASLR
ncbi:hypothetical protein CR194_10315 [Salipaludibacillus keqinensis]|uniref:Uncharacterized protein n=1 Tax=Salipaludibacillus keqinensis TaxID=2045207 RepID=A0A323TEY5_9BACI|nr:hypothetical protein [Salipaludibacillus keqinensis]PYZ93551.1 hypothetical protein CR194_10315 [Salipaludibacillus keqinensis]